MGKRRLLEGGGIARERWGGEHRGLHGGTSRNEVHFIPHSSREPGESTNTNASRAREPGKISGRNQPRSSRELKKNDTVGEHFFYYTRAHPSARGISKAQHSGGEELYYLGGEAILEKS